MYPGQTLERATEYALVIGRRTAETHLGHCLGKLGLATRAQLAAWAVEQSLAAAPLD